MGKRKRDSNDEGRAISTKTDHANSSLKARPGGVASLNSSRTTTIQIIAGSYDRVLHGLTATISDPPEKTTAPAPEVEFADTFLFNAHTSAIRCLALSPLPSLEDTTQSPKLILASGSTDERINLYHIAASVSRVPEGKGVPLPSLGPTRVQENPKNRELGSLLHHASSITALYFPTRSKLLSAAEDNTIAISRTRDWTVLSTIKAPIPKAVGRPSGDTAPLGGTPAGINDFAVHPSMKLMISVGKGEKCMRLWNLVTGKKAGVLTFESDILRGIGEGKWGSGQGRNVAWNGNGDEFIVGFERGAVVFGMDSKPKCRVVPTPVTKIHQIRYIFPETRDGQISDILAVSTEDGRIIFYSTSATNANQNHESESKPSVPTCKALGQLGGKALGLTMRIKDFEFVTSSGDEERKARSFIIIGSSDGSIRIWRLERAELEEDAPHTNGSSGADSARGPEMDCKDKVVNGSDKGLAHQVGKLLGTYESGNRITCLKAFIMLNSSAVPQTGTDDDWADEFDGIAGSDTESSYSSGS
ncbi:hypothetical protein MMC30_002319 [Trapelia coarctata]|nr:hypothetical protein [Trapelia coarctata]